LLPLNLPEGLQVDAAHGGTITLAKVPGFSLTIAPGSVTFPDGTNSGLVSVTLVHADKVPMTPNFGQQPRFIVSIQPAGAKFNPPAPMTIPNADGLGPGEVTEMYSFDHDLGSFVAIGTGTVSGDGTVIKSDPGVGIIKGGWHCGGNPTTTGTASCACGTNGPRCAPGGSVPGEILACRLARPAYCVTKFGDPCQAACDSICDPADNPTGFQACINLSSAAEVACLAGTACPFNYCL
jgi:hypothetical protein